MLHIHVQYNNIDYLLDYVWHVFNTVLIVGVAIVGVAIVGVAIVGGAVVSGTVVCLTH